MANFLKNITALRKKYPKSKLGFREKDILNAAGAKVTKARGYTNCYRVTKGNKSFVFTYGQKGYANFTVVE